MGTSAPSASGRTRFYFEGVPGLKPWATLLGHFGPRIGLMTDEAKFSDITFSGRFLPNRMGGLFQNRLMKAFPVVNPVKGDCITNTDIRRQFILAEHGLYGAFVMIVTSD
jgi:hypothetical protein